MNETRHLTILARIALVVTAGDLGTKAAAVELLGSDAAFLNSWLHFAVVHNDRGAFGWSIGNYTWQLNLALTLAAVVFMIPVTRDLARVDPSAPRALGLIVGGALGNLASLVSSPVGVVDFIQLDFEGFGIALNVADVAAYCGLALVLRTGARVVTALRQEWRLREPRRDFPVRSVFAEKAALTRSLHSVPAVAAADAAAVTPDAPAATGPAPRHSVGRGSERLVADWSVTISAPPADHPADPSESLPNERPRPSRLVIGELSSAPRPRAGRRLRMAADRFEADETGS